MRCFFFLRPNGFSSVFSIFALDGFMEWNGTEACGMVCFCFVLFFASICPSGLVYPGDSQRGRVGSGWVALGWLYIGQSTG